MFEENLTSAALSNSCFGQNPVCSAEQQMKKHNFPQSDGGLPSQPASEQGLEIEGESRTGRNGEDSE